MHRTLPQADSVPQDSSLAQHWIVKALAEEFYGCVPIQYRTYCVLTSSISARVLSAFGFLPKLVSCQLWCDTPKTNYVLGFAGAPPSGRWDGHLVCVVGNQLVDAATSHIRNEFRLPVPDIVVTSLFQIPTQLLSRYDLDECNRIWWLRPPEGMNVEPPVEPAAVVNDYANALIEKISERKQL